MSQIIDCQINPRQYAEEFKKHEISGTSYLQYRDLKKLVGQYMKGKEALDYGCGAGNSTVFLRSLGLNVTGVDINEHIIKCALEKDVGGRYDVITSGIVPADDNTYDIVFASWVMTSVSTKSEMKKIGKEICRILKPDGVFIMVVGCKERYNKDWLSINTEFPENQTLYSGCRIKTLLKECNVILHSYFWTEEDYKEMIEYSNMTLLEIHSPLGNDSDGYNWNLEKFVSPMNIYVAKKN